MFTYVHVVKHKQKKITFYVWLQDRYTRPDYTFKVVARGFSKKCTISEQLFEVHVYCSFKKILHVYMYVYMSILSFFVLWKSQRLSYLPLAGKVDLSNPDHEFHLLEDYGDNPNEAPPAPQRLFFGRLVSRGQRNLIHKYSLKKRHFIGNTSMDAQLSLIMANMAQVRLIELMWLDLRYSNIFECLSIVSTVYVYMHIRTCIYVHVHTLQ